MRQYLALRKLPHAPPQLLLFLSEREIHMLSGPLDSSAIPFFFSA
jgi:hypothetical protein